MFPVISVEEGAADNVEYLGSKQKFWFNHSEFGRSLWKAARPNTGEDWSEKIAEQFALQLGLPCARYEFADCDGKKGVITPTIVPEEASLILGNELLVAQESNYPAPGTVSKFRTSQHTIEIVLNNLRESGAELPPDWTPLSGIQTAQDLFVGYLLLDAWIGNTDRHHENWAIIDRIDSPPRHRRQRYLAPTYDHASSLGCHLLDSERLERLSTKDQGRTVEAYTNKATSALYLNREDPKPLKTVDAFRLAAARSPIAAHAWLEKLASIGSDATNAPFDELPEKRITRHSAEFARRMLYINRTRLLALREELL